MININEIIEKLRIYFERRDDISMAFLYGSWSKNQECADSDVDIAIYFKPRGRALEWEETDYYNDSERSTWVDIEVIIEKDVDLLILNRAVPTIADSAIRGIPIIIKDRKLYMDFLLRITSEAIDFRQWIEHYWNYKRGIKREVIA